MTNTNTNGNGFDISDLIELGAPQGSPTDTDDRLFTPDEITPSASDRQLIPVLGDIATEGAQLAATVPVSRTYLSAEERAEIRAREGVSLRPAPSLVPAAAPAPIPAMLSGANMVAGAAAAGEAVLCGWDGKDELTLATIRARVAAAGLGVELLPTPRTARAQLGRAVSDACGSTYDHKIEKATDVDGERAYAARWTISTSNPGAAVGEPTGYAVATITLDKSGALLFDTKDQTLEATIRTEYDRRVAAEVFNSADVTAWLRGVLTTTLGGVKLGGVYYVPRSGAAAAEALCASMATVWGTNWIAPALPVATTEQLRVGIVAGLAAEADDVMRRFELARVNAREEHAAGTRKAADLTARAAGTFLGELRTVAERSVSYAGMLGAELVAPLRTAVIAAMETAVKLMNDTAQRAELIYEEIEAERALGINRDTAATRAHIEAA